MHFRSVLAGTAACALCAFSGIAPVFAEDTAKANAGVVQNDPGQVIDSETDTAGDIEISYEVVDDSSDKAVTDNNDKATDNNNKNSAAVNTGVKSNNMYIYIGVLAAAAGCIVIIASSKRSKEKE